MKVIPIQKFNFYRLKEQNKYTDTQTLFADSPNKQYNATFPNAKAALAFLGFTCSTEDFAPRNLYDIPCASCGETTIQPRQVENFVKTVKNLKGEELIAELNKKNNFYKQFEKNIVEKIIEVAKDNPDFELKEIIKYLSSKSMNDLLASQLDVLNSIRDAAKNLKNEDRAIIIEYINREENLIKNPNYEKDEYFQRLKFINDLINIGKNISNGNIFKKIMLIAETIPSSSTSESAFYVSYSRKENDEIVRRLVTSSLATTEHMLPVSKGGDNNSSNYIVMCAGCNSRRTNMPYSEWLKSMPSLVDNLNKYLSEVDSRIEDGELGYEYIGYPEEAHKAFEEQLGKKIPQFVKKPIVQDTPQVDESESEIDRIQENTEFLTNLMTARLRNLSDLKSIAKVYKADPRFTLFQELKKQEEILKNLKTKRKEIEKQKDEFRKKIEVLEKRQARSEACQAELKTCTDQKKANELRDEIKKISYNKEKHQECAIKYEEIQIEYKKIQDTIKEIMDKISESKKQVLFPEEYNKKIKELEVKIDVRKELRFKIANLKKERDTISTNSLGVPELTEKLKKIQRQISASGFGNINSILENEFVKKYIELNNKLDYIKNNKIISNQSRQINSEMLLSIFDEAKSSIEKKMAELMKKKEVRYYLLEKEKEKLESEIASSEENEKKIALIDEKISGLETELEMLIDELSDEDLYKLYKELKEEESKTLKILRNLDIEERIQKAEIQLNSLSSTIENLKKKLYKLMNNN